MAQLIFNALKIIIVLYFASSCASHGCLNEKLAEAELAAANTKVSEAANAEMVKVFKYDGTLQCGMGKAIPIDVMAKELDPLKIFTSEQKNDGLMRIQLCGSPTGSANIYQILKADLDKAKKKGFKEWTFE